MIAAAHIARPLGGTLGAPLCGVSPIDPEATAWRNAVFAAGSSVSVQAYMAVSRFVQGCKADSSPNPGVSNWAAMKQIGLLCAASTLAGVLVPLKGEGPLISTNFVSADYSPTLGLLGDGSTKSLNSRRGNSSDPQNNKSGAAYITNARNSCLLGIATTEMGSTQLMGSGSALLARCNSGTGATTTGSGNTGAGFYGLSRNSATDLDYNIPGAAGTLATGSWTPINGNLVVFGRGTTGAPSGLSSSRLTFFSIGEAVNLAALKARLETLMGGLS